MKQCYLTPSIHLVEWDVEDVLTASDSVGEDVNGVKDVFGEDWEW